MSETQPIPAKRGNGSKYLALFFVGLVVGVIGTVMAMRALDARKDHFHESVMYVQQWHMGQLKGKIQDNRCNATEVLPHLKTLRTMADDLEPAFPDLADDQRFRQHAGRMRGTLDAALASPPLSCQAAAQTAAKIGESCKACHQDFN